MPRKTIVPKASEDVGAGVVTVTWRNNTREFSKAVHGADFRDLAEQFAAKHGGTVA